MAGERYNEEFKIAAVKQVTEGGYSIADLFNYIELFYNPTRRHGNNNDLSPMEYEKNYFLKQGSV